MSTMNDIAFIEVAVKTNPLGKREAVNYRWVGDSPYTRIDWNMLDEMNIAFDKAERIQVGPYKLLEVEKEYSFGGSLYVRSDKFGFLRVVFYKSTRLLDLIYRRTIITLAVWNLAEFSPIRVPDWKDIKALKWIAKRWN